MRAGCIVYGTLKLNRAYGKFKEMQQVDVNRGEEEMCEMCGSVCNIQCSNGIPDCRLRLLDSYANMHTSFSCV